MRNKFVAGNWKMHGSRPEIQSLLEAIKLGSNTLSAIDIAVFPSFVHLQATEAILVDSPVEWGGQNLYLAPSGAFTGEISAPMLVDYGCQYVLIGHSERRTLFHENLALVSNKCKTALEYGLKPILCIGETREEREQGKMENILKNQLVSVFEAIGKESIRYLTIAYEPVWAIGTGITATPAQAEEAHQYIRQQILSYRIDVADTVRILYGGSVNPENASHLFAMPNVDGALVGGASLVADSFLAICHAAMNSKR